MDEEQDSASTRYARALLWMAEHRCYRWPEWTKVDWPELIGSNGVNLDYHLLAQVDFHAHDGAKWHELNDAGREWHRAWIWEWLDSLKELLLLLIFIWGGGKLGVGVVHQIWLFHRYPYTSAQEFAIFIGAGTGFLLWFLFVCKAHYPGIARKVSLRLKAYLRERRPDLASKYA